MDTIKPGLADYPKVDMLGVWYKVAAKGLKAPVK